MGIDASADAGASLANTGAVYASKAGTAKRNRVGRNETGHSTESYEESSASACSLPVANSTAARA